MDEGISSRFFRILEYISLKLPALKLGDKILPGILVLRGFQGDTFGCKWAKEILRKAVCFRGDDYDYGLFLEFYKVIVRDNALYPLDFVQVLDMFGELTEKMDQIGMYEFYRFRA